MTRVQGTKTVVLMVAIAAGWMVGDNAGGDTSAFVHSQRKIEASALTAPVPVWVNLLMARG